MYIGAYMHYSTKVWRCGFKLVWMHLHTSRGYTVKRICWGRGVFEKCHGRNKYVGAYMMSVVGKSTCSGFKTGLYVSYHGANAVGYIKERSYFLRDGQISGHFDTEFMSILQIEQISHNFEDQKMANFSTSNRSIFA